jgi:uncharacterized RDD family membrane protein YckC
VENRIGFGKRLGAFLIDCVLVWVVAFFGGSTIGGLLGLGAGAALTSGDADAMKGMAMAGAIGAAAGVLIAAAVVGTVYFLVEGFTGWTFGKLILGIQIGNQDGTKANLGQLLERYALKNCNFILTILAVFTHIAILRTIGSLGGLAIFIGYFFVLSANKQGFHDMIAKTAVYPRAQLQGS